MSIPKKESNTLSAQLTEKEVGLSNRIPMDLNYSPIEDFLNQSITINNQTHKKAAAPPSSTSDSDTKTMPVLIPNSFGRTRSTVGGKKDNKWKKKSLAKTVPDNGLEAVIERRFKRSNECASSTQTTKNNSQSFFVGSLQDKPPVPWPTNLTSTPDLNRHRLTNRQTVNWPFVPGNHRWALQSFEDEEDVFNMDDDYHNISDGN